MRSSERLRRALEGKPFALLAVNVGEGARVARSFADTIPARFTWLLDRDTQTAKAWRARVLPASYLIEIGRASCRERGEMSAGDESAQKKGNSDGGGKRCVARSS